MDEQPAPYPGWKEWVLVLLLLPFVGLCLAAMKIAAAAAPPSRRAAPILGARRLRGLPPG